MMAQTVYETKRELLWARHDEYRRLSDEAGRRAEEAHAKDDFEGWKTNTLLCLEYLRYCYDIADEIRKLAQEELKELA